MVRSTKDGDPRVAVLVDGVHVEHANVNALGGVSVAVAEGETVALVGPSGAGKTTLLRVMNGTQRPTRGHVVVRGARLDALSSKELRAVRASVGFVHQHLGLVPNLRVVQNVVSGGLGRRSLAQSVRAFAAPARGDVERAYALLERVGIAEKLYERVGSLSGGQQQRVAIARALFQQPSILLADEPVASVDPARAADTVALLADLAREQRITLVVSLHDVVLAREHCARLIGMRAGRVVFDAPPADVSAGALESLYRLDARVSGDRVD